MRHLVALQDDLEDTANGVGIQSRSVVRVSAGAADQIGLAQIGCAGLKRCPPIAPSMRSAATYMGIPPGKAGGRPNGTDSVRKSRRLLGPSAPCTGLRYVRLLDRIRWGQRKRILLYRRPNQQKQTRG